MTIAFSAKFLSRYKPTTVYWHLDVDGQVLYVGCTSDLQRRHKEHRSRSGWYGQIAAVRWSEPMPWGEALALEREMIVELQPPNNTVHRKRQLAAEREEAKSA